MSYLLISPCRNEEDYLRVTLDSVAAQSVTPTKWVIVDDGSTDSTPQILAEYAAKYPWIEIVNKEDRGMRSVGPGVIESFYRGVEAIDMTAYDYICKLDVDLDLPPRYFETLIGRMTENPRIGTCSGKPYFIRGDRKISEKCGDEMSVGMTKFYRRQCFEEIGGFVREVMWDAIDCHTCRYLGWIACSWDDPEIRFIHLRPMGSSQKGILTGRIRHGFGQYFMGSAPFYFLATAIYRMFHPPYIIGGCAMAYGYFKSMVRGDKRFDNMDLVKFIRRYQNRALFVGKAKAVAEIDARNELNWEQKIKSRA